MDGKFLREIRPYTLAVVAKAMAGDYKIVACESCGGPRIYAKTKAASKCFGCLDYRTEEELPPTKTRQLCRRCKKFTYQVIKSIYCAICREKVIDRKSRG